MITNREARGGVTLNPFPNNEFQTLKLKSFADDNLKFDENGRNFSKRVENIVRKRRNCSLGAISPFPTMFSKDLYGRHKNEGLFGKALRGKKWYTVCFPLVYDKIVLLLPQSKDNI